MNQSAHVKYLTELENGVIQTVKQGYNFLSDKLGSIYNYMRGNQNQNEKLLSEEDSKQSGVEYEQDIKYFELQRERLEKIKKFVENMDQFYSQKTKNTAEILKIF